MTDPARVQGWLSSVWGLSAVAGPLAGGLVVQHLHWAWIFWINVPFGLLAVLGAGIVMIAVITYLPTYAQGVLGTSALVAGFTLTTMSIGWPVSSVIAGRLMVRRGTRFTARVGGVALVAGAGLFLGLDAVRTPWWAAGASLVVGAGMGFLTTTFLVAVQTRVDWTRRGAATATNMLMRILGDALGAALLGGVVNAGLLGFLRRTGLADRVRLDDVTRLLGEGGAFDAELAARISGGLADALDLAFRVTAGVALLTLAAAFAMPDLETDETR